MPWCAGVMCARADEHVERLSPSGTNTSRSPVATASPYPTHYGPRRLPTPQDPATRRCRRVTRAAPCRTGTSDGATPVRRAAPAKACRRNGSSDSATQPARDTTGTTPPATGARRSSRRGVGQRRRPAPEPPVAKIDVLARLAACLIRAAGNRRPIARGLQLRPAPLDLAVNSRLDQHKRTAVLPASATSARRASSRCPTRPTAPSRNELRHVRPCTRRSRRAAVAVAEITTSCASR